MRAKGMPQFKSKTARQLQEMKFRQKKLIQYVHEMRRVDQSKTASISNIQRISFIKQKMSRIRVLLGYISKVSNSDPDFPTPF